jgi:hypothetical protein
MNILPDRKTPNLSRRLSAIRTDAERLGGDLRGLADDIADLAMTRAGTVVHPVARTLTVVSTRLNGNRRSSAFSLSGLSNRPWALVAASVGTAALIGGIMARR